MNTAPKTIHAAEPEDRVLVIPHKAIVTPVLGRIQVEGAALHENTHPKQNSSRWMFDVFGRTGCDIQIKLLEFRSGRHIIHEFVSPYFSPTSEAFYDAKPFFVIEPGLITIKTLKVVDTCAYRVSVDAIYSATR